MANKVGAPTGIEPVSPDNIPNLNALFGSGWGSQKIETWDFILEIVLNSQEHCLTLIGVHHFPQPLDDVPGASFEFF